MKNKKVNKIISCFNNDDFYQRKFSGLQVSNFENIPTIDSRDVVELYNSKNKNDSTVFFTSGTTGDPKAIYYGKKDIKYISDYISWLCSIEKISGGETVLVLMDQSFWGVGYVTGQGHIKAGNAVVPIDNDLPKEKLVDIINSVKPSVISSLPSVLLEMGDVINGYKFKLIETTGEKLSMDDRSKIEKMYGGEVYDAYGLTEAVIGAECSQHDGYHYNDDKIILEIFDNEGNQLKDGKWGELVITTTEATPIIRYRSGDKCLISHKKCECGSKYPKIWIEGRIKPTVLLHEGYKMEKDEILNLVNSVSPDSFVDAHVSKVSESKYLLNVITNDKIDSEDRTKILSKISDYSYELMHMLRNNKLEIIFKENERH